MWLRRWTLSSTAVAFLLPILSFAPTASAAGCTYDTSTSATGARNATSLTYSFTPAASSNMTVVVGVNELQTGATPPSSVTYNGASMTKVTNTHAANTAIDVSIWILYVGTTDGAAHNVVVTGTAGTLNLTSVAWSYTGTASTQTGASAVGGGTGTSGTATLTTTAANSCVAGMLFVNTTVAVAGTTATSPTTLDKSQDSDATSGVSGYGGHNIAASASSQTVGFTFSSNLWEEAATEVLGATVAAATPATQSWFYWW